MRSLIILPFVFAAATAEAHEIGAYLTPSGLEFVEAQLPSYVPTRLQPPAFAKTLATCPGGAPVVAEQRATEVALEVHDLTLSVPRAQILRLEVVFSVRADGTLWIDNPYACFGEATCQDRLTVTGARAVAEFQPLIGGDGVPRVELVGFDLDVGPDEVDFRLSGCAISGVLNLVIDFGKSWLVGYLTDAIEELAHANLAPVLGEFVAGLGDYRGTVGIADISARVASLDLTNAGLRAAADVDLSTIFPADACVAAADPGEPATEPGAAPELRGEAAHAAVAVNLGLLNDGVYHIWRDGLMCVTDAHLQALGLPLDLDHLAASLGLASKPALAVRLGAPPRVVSGSGAGASVVVHLDQLEIELSADVEGHPVGLRADADVAIAATVVLDPGRGALALRLEDATLGSLRITSAWDFDAGRVRQALADHIIPSLKAQLDHLPISGPILNVADYYLIPRRLGTQPGFVFAAVDFFRAPANDRNPPTTEIVSAPTGVVAPSAAIVVARGADAEVPEELLRYRFFVDGVARAPSYVRELRVGEAGVTRSYDVGVVAVDLAGNEDGRLARVKVTVDGIAPQVAVHGERSRRSDEPVVTLAWSAADDLTETEALDTRVEVRRLEDPTDSQSGVVVQELAVGAGQTSATLGLPGGGVYRLEVQVRDGAGNIGRSTLIFTVTEPGGCSAGGPAPANLLLAALAALLLLARRRSAQAPRAATARR